MRFKRDYSMEIDRRCIISEYLIRAYANSKKANLPAHPHRPCPGSDVTKVFSCSTLLKIKCYNANENCWHFNIYEQNIFHTQLS